MGNGFSTCLSENIECNTGVGVCLCKGLACSCGVAKHTPEPTPLQTSREIPASPVDVAIRVRLAQYETEMITQIMSRIGNPDLRNPENSIVRSRSPTLRIIVPRSPIDGEDKAAL